MLDNITGCDCHGVRKTHMATTSSPKAAPVSIPLPKHSKDIEFVTDVSTCKRFAGLSDIFDHDDKAHVPDFLLTERVESVT